MQRVCANPSCSQLGHPLPDTDVEGSSSFSWNGRVSRHMFTACTTRKLCLAKLWTKTSQSLFLFRQSDLFCLCFIDQQPPHFHYEDFSLFIENLNTDSLLVIPDIQRSLSLCNLSDFNRTVWRLLPFHYVLIQLLIHKQYSKLMLLYLAE